MYLRILSHKPNHLHVHTANWPTKSWLRIQLLVPWELTSSCTEVKYAYPLGEWGMTNYPPGPCLDNHSPTSDPAATWADRNYQLHQQPWQHQWTTYSTQLGATDETLVEIFGPSLPELAGSWTLRLQWRPVDEQMTSLLGCGLCPTYLGACCWTRPAWWFGTAMRNKI